MLLWVLSRETSSWFTCLNCDLEKINVTMGIKHGDQLLVQVSEL